MRFFLKKKWMLSVLVLITTGMVLLHNGIIGQVPLLSFNSPYSEDSFSRASQEVRDLMHYTNYVYSGYDDFIKLYRRKAEVAKAAPLEDKCAKFFEQHAKHFPEWTFPEFQDKGKTFDKSVVHKQEYFNKLQGPLLEERGKDAVLTRNDNNSIDAMFTEEVKKSYGTSKEMADTASLLRVYGKCFIGQTKDHLAKNNLANVYKDYTHKMFPFLNKNRIPLFQPVNREELEVNQMPVYENNGWVGNVSYDMGNIVEFYSNHKSGRGIVVSASTRHGRDLIKLIRVLRAMNNRLPIQILYKSDLSRKMMEAISRAATEDVDFLFNPLMAPEHESVMPELKLLEQYKEYGSEFPKQDLWFVNIVNCITRDYKYKFPGFANKLLAMFYSSFKETILLDADTVPLIPVRDFFETKEYLETGTMFFQDRELRDFNDWVETNFFAQLFPQHNEKSLDAIFGIPAITEKTMENRYMTGWRHFQEAGVVVMDQSKHLLGLLMTFPLCLWKEPVKSSIWGDKEMYWLGMAMAGDENYAFNELSAASVGEITEKRHHKHYPNSTANEVCSTHPGHVYKDTGKLLWINSGFSYCKMNGYFRDRMQFPFKSFEGDSVQELYSQPVKIRGAIVPPKLPHYREPFNPTDLVPERTFRKSWSYRHRDVDDEEDGNRPFEVVEDYNPQKGWMKNPICFGYFYCAYDAVESYTEDGKTDTGFVYHFDEKEARLYDYLGKVWITGNTRLVPRTKTGKKVDHKNQEEKEKQEKEKEEKEKQEKEEKEKQEKEKEKEKEQEETKEGQDQDEVSEPLKALLDSINIVPGKKIPESEE